MKRQTTRVLLEAEQTSSCLTFLNFDLQRFARTNLLSLCVCAGPRSVFRFLVSLTPIESLVLFIRFRVLRALSPLGELRIGQLPLLIFALLKGKALAVRRIVRLTLAPTLTDFGLSLSFVLRVRCEAPPIVGSHVVSIAFPLLFDGHVQLGSERCPA